MGLLSIFQPLTPHYGIVDNGNTTVTHLGGGIFTVEKTAGASAYGNASAVSSIGTTGDFVLRVNATALPGGMMVGMNSDPLTDNDYLSIDYTWNNPHPGLGTIYESGVNISSPGGSANHWIWRVGTTLYYGRGADLATAQAAPDRTVAGATATLYFDSSFLSIGDKVEVELFDLTTTAVTGSASLAFAPSATISGQGALSGTVSLVLVPAGTVTGKGALTGSTTAVLSPSGTLTGKGALTGTSTLVLSPSGTITGKGAISGASALAFAPAGTLGGLGALSGSSALSFTADGLLDAGGNVDQITGSVTLAFSAAGNVVGLGGLSGSASFAFLLLSGSLSTRLWNVVELAVSAFVNDSPASGSWAVIAPPVPDYVETAPGSGTWTETPPNTGTWN